MKVVMGLSGGMDSATLLGYWLNKGAEVHACHFQYGSKHNKYELVAIQEIIEFYRRRGFKINLNTFDLTGIFAHYQSNLLQSGGEIPEGHYESESMKLTVVPGRNTIFASIMLGLAETVGADIISLGVHAGDHHIYPDCRLDYIKSLSETLNLASDGKVKVEAPFINLDKTGILKIGFNLGTPTPYELTRTCYKDQENSCGKCGSCQERLEAFANLNLIDPIEYEK